MDRKYFGTDGVRGAVGKFPITPEFVLKLGWAAGSVLAKNGKKRVLIGKDTRISGYMLESALEAGLSAAGIKSLLLGPMPTPAVSYLTKAFRADAGVVISASHNPDYDNGIKFFSRQGTKLPDEVEAEIEKLLDHDIVCTGSENLGKAERIDDATGRYIEFCKSTFPNDLSLEGLRIVLDCANGATYRSAPSVFRELGAKVTTIGTAPNGININDGVGSTHPEALARKVVETGADLGIAFDGDGDRVMLVDKTGYIIDGDEVLFIVARDMQERGVFRGGVVGTLMSNLGLELALTKIRIPFIRSAVGDRYVMEELLDNNWRLGGENSGHVICLDYVSTGDGIVSALQALRALVRKGCSLEELRSGISKCPQKLVNVKFVEGLDPLHAPNVLVAVKRAEEQLGKRGRVLRRKSGTEPLIRVMVEGLDEKEVSDLADMIAHEVSEVK